MKRFIAMALVTLVIFALYAEEKATTLTLETRAVQGFSGEALTDVDAVILDEFSLDTIAKAEKKIIHIGRMGGEMRLSCVLNFKVPRTKGLYLIKAYAPDCDTVYSSVNINRIGGREFERNLPDLVFYKTPKRNLSEVTVTASKVKFYVKGDTIVYNADAFQLAEGSMLDALVKQLPGVELKENGQIFVNGKFVESLLLNGKDFFQGNNSLMLNNLGAYTVKNVSVYDKLGEKGMLAGTKVGDERFVMDVQLKKEYMSGFIGNIGAGGGTSDRYLGRLFGMWYTPISRVALIGSVNNLNDSRTPGQNDSWTVSNNPGDMRTKMGGLDYRRDAEDKKWEFYGNTTVQHARAHDVSTVNSTNFLASGDTYENRFANAIDRSLRFTTDNHVVFRPNRKSIAIGQKLNYDRNSNEASKLSGMFLADNAEMSRALLEKIYSGEVASFADQTINLVNNLSKSRGNALEAKISANAYFTLPYSSDILGIVAEGNYNEHRKRTFALYDIKNPLAATSTTDYRYERNIPDRNWNLFFGTSYDYKFSSLGRLTVGAKYYHSDKTKDSYLYRLDRLTDIGMFGELPPDYPATLDEGQTYFSSEKTDYATINMNLTNQIRCSNGNMLMYQLIAFCKYDWRNLVYRRPEFIQHVNKNSLSIESPRSVVNYTFGKYNLQLEYFRTVRQPDLVRLVDISDSHDPLNIFEGAPNLKNATDNDFRLRFTYRKNGTHRISEIATLTWVLTENDLASGYSLNEMTGVRTYRMYNIGGNYRLSLRNYFTILFGAKDEFTLSATTNGGYVRAADMVGTAAAGMSQSEVKNTTFSQSVSLSRQIGKHKIGLSGKVDFRDTRSQREDFNNFNATDTQYGANAQFTLPANFSFSTDINVYTRRGYSDNALNTSDVVWNARLAYTAAKGKWVFMLDGFDLLGQLSNVTYNVNAQGRTETYTNVLPRYGLFHIQYRFAVQPKKK